MKTLIFTGMVIIFVSVFFMLGIFDALVKSNVQCINELGSMRCNLKEFGFSFILGLLLIGMFFMIDVAVVYLLVSSASKQTFSLLDE